VSLSVELYITHIILIVCTMQSTTLIGKRDSLPDKEVFVVIGRT